MTRFFILLSLIFIVFQPLSSSAEVRFGNNVHVGGNDFSHRTYNKNRNANIHIYNKKPRHEGCRWVPQRDRHGRPTGRKTQVCHLQRR